MRKMQIGISREIFAMDFTAAHGRRTVRDAGASTRLAGGLCAALLALAAAAAPGPALAIKASVGAVYSFANPTAPHGLTSSSGTFYGVTATGGTHGLGSVFAISHDGQLTTIHSFDGDDGAGPLGPLLLGADGFLYGTTAGIAAYGGPQSNYGTVFRIGPGSELTTLYQFTGRADGGYPQGGLVQDSAGNIYGTTSGFIYGSQAVNDGTVFKLTPAGQFSTLHAFAGADGAFPTSTLVEGSDGSLYGATEGGGGSQECNVGPKLLLGCGTLYRITPQGQFTSLHSFNALATSTDGAFPVSLIRASDGKLYGNTSSGGASPTQSGTIFEFDPPATLTTLHSFQGADGANPAGQLVEAQGGFFGVTANGGYYGYGTVFAFYRGQYLPLYSFSSTTAPGYTPDSLVLGPDNRLYGTAAFGGADGGGTVFAVTLTHQ